MKQITLQITTKNRINELKESLIINQNFISDERVHTIICVDGSNDNTYTYVKNSYPSIELIENPRSIGLIASRNRMMTLTKTPYAVSIDDDAHFISDNSVNEIITYFEEEPECAVIAFRIFWGKEKIRDTHISDNPSRVRGFVGCGHAWRLDHWRLIRPYPEWFVFYGEEEFASFELFKYHLEIHYVPKVFIQHRVDVKSRKKETDYIRRMRRSLRSGWYLMLMFYPLADIPKLFLYTIWIQFKNKTLKGDWKASIGIMLAIGDLFVNLRKIAINSSRLTKQEFEDFDELGEVKIYWNE